MSVIAVKNLCHRFADGTIGLDNVNLNVAQGAFVVIAGPNGSGKTTLLKHLNGLLRPDEGEVRLDGVAVAKDVRGARQFVGMVFQDADSQIVGETVYDDVAFGPENLKLDRNEIQRRVGRALASVGLQALAQQRPHLLSGGEKRRLAIAGVLAMHPQVLAFDEPFANLDYAGIRQVLEAILRLHDKGHTILVTTHDLEKIIAHADRLVLMQKGRIAYDGPPQAITVTLEDFGLRTPCALRFGRKVESWLM